MDSIDFFVKLESISTFLGALITFGGLLYAGYQLRASKKISEGEFLLRLDELFSLHNDVHVKLRPGGDWSVGKKGPVTTEEWVSVERYMGLFERIQLLIDNKIIDIKTVNRLYGYRIINIAKNDIIRQAKIEREEKSWEDFIKLWKEIKRIRAL